MTHARRPVYRFGDFRLDTAERELRRGEVAIPLAPKAYETLLALVERAGHLVEKETLLQRVWPNSFVEESNLTQNIFTVRKALGETPDGRSYVETLPKRGYRFVGQVEEIDSAAAARVEPEIPGLEVLPSVTLGGRAHRGWWAAAALLVAAIALGVAGRDPLSRWFTEVQPLPVRSMAVLPLENLSGDPAQDYFADGMTDALITNLAQIGSVRVISRTSVMRFKGVKRPLPDIARELNVDAVIEGTVTRSANRVRITAQLIDARTDQHLWARSYERDLGEVLTLQREISRAIAGEVNAQLTPRLEQYFAGSGPADPDVEEAYLQGRYHVNKGSQEEIEKGIGFFRQALARNPRDARSYAAIAGAYLWLSDFYLPPAAMLPQAKEAAIAAIALDDSLADSHTALGAVRFLYDWDWTGAERELRRAIELNPGSADAHMWYATFLAQVGRASAAAEEARRAQALDPLSLAVHVSSGWVFYLGREPALALAEWRRVLDLEPQFAFSHTAIWAAYMLGPEFAKLRMSAVTKVPQPLDTMELAARIGASAASGAVKNADALMAQLVQRSAHEYFCPYEMAVAEAMLGRSDEALRWLKKSIDERSACVPSMKADPRLDSLRTDSRFAELIRIANCPH